jgi:hypothetical protein
MYNPDNYKPPSPAELKAMRKRADLSQAAAARIVGCSVRKWQKYESTVSREPVPGKVLNWNWGDIPFAELALFRIVALKESPKKWAKGLSRKDPDRGQRTGRYMANLNRPRKPRNS